MHNYFGNNPKTDEKLPRQYQSPKKELKDLLAKEKTEEVFERLLDLTEKQDKNQYDMVLLLSARFNRVNNQENKGIISNAEAGIERNRINNSLASLIDELKM